jgi:hypothetical protein
MVFYKCFKEEKNIIKGKNITLKQQLLNSKDIEINKLYKNRLLKDKVGDIKIKIRECDFIRLNEDILSTEADSGMILKHLEVLLTFIRLT